MARKPAIGGYMTRWTKTQEDFLKLYYPTHGKHYCAQQLGKRESQIRDKAFRIGLKQNKRSDWKAGWREIGGLRKYYRSRWEANYARYLQWLKEHGQIASWKHEPETFWFDGVKRGCVSYLPDFRVIDIDGRVIYHEVKGWMDDRSITKIKRMAKYHPTVRLIVIDGNGYKSIAKKVSGMIKDWE